MDEAAANERLAELAGALRDGKYRPGAWQRFVAEFDRSNPAVKQSLALRVSDVSRRLHRRKRRLELPFAVALMGEGMLFLAGTALLFGDGFVSRLIGLAAIVLTAQPLIKVVCGLILGVRYDYAYLWGIEPRFKMRYGQYLLLAQPVRVAFHLAGSIGTPAAMLAGYFTFRDDYKSVAIACVVFFLGAAALQVGAFLAEWLGVRRIFGYRLSTLTSPATAAFELRRR